LEGIPGTVFKSDHILTITVKLATLQDVICVEMVAGVSSLLGPPIHFTIWLSLYFLLSGGRPENSQSLIGDTLHRPDSQCRPWYRGSKCNIPFLKGGSFLKDHGFWLCHFQRLFPTPTQSWRRP
jgi:hypothetical protein